MGLLFALTIWLVATLLTGAILWWCFFFAACIDFLRGGGAAGTTTETNLGSPSPAPS